LPLISPCYNIFILGIPDYRSEGVGLYQRSNHKPIQHPEFVKFAATRKRYWARNFLGWPKFSSVEPNATHHKLARMERELRLSHIITQNVDNLHGKAGSKEVTELHGNGYKVICIGKGERDNPCDYSIPRHDFQLILNQLNPQLLEKAKEFESSSAQKTMRPDGDIELLQKDVEKFFLPECPKCGGYLKPNIVFFGDNVPRSRIDKVVKCIIDSDGVLVLGSSLTVFSGYRIVLQAKELGLAVAVINIGETRADKIVDIKINSKCSDIMKLL
jgi:NAD+-dependent protein deacetylase sirtuin 4